MKEEEKEELKKLKYTEVKYLPKNIKIATVIQIYNDKTILHSNISETTIVVVIDNNDITNLTNLFRECLEPLGKISNLWISVQNLFFLGTKF